MTPISVEPVGIDFAGSTRRLAKIVFYTVLNFVGTIVGIALLVSGIAQHRWVFGLLGSGILLAIATFVIRAIRRSGRAHQADLRSRAWVQYCKQCGVVEASDLIAVPASRVRVWAGSVVAVTIAVASLAVAVALWVSDIDKAPLVAVKMLAIGWAVPSWIWAMSRTSTAACVTCGQGPVRRVAVRTTASANPDLEP
jgi:hypothetical protein